MCPQTRTIYRKRCHRCRFCAIPFWAIVDASGRFVTQPCDARQISETEVGKTTIRAQMRFAEWGQDYRNLVGGPFAGAGTDAVSEEGQSALISMTNLRRIARAKS
jgi:hypothetical protein